MAAITLVFSERAGGPLYDKSGLHSGFSARSLLLVAGEVATPPPAAFGSSPSLTGAADSSGDNLLIFYIYKIPFDPERWVVPWEAKLHF